ncbi:MAG: amidohydrolase family protein [Promethearchaeota archaeon]
MVILSRIFSKYALIGENLTLKENVLIKINNKGKISRVECDTPPKKIISECSFSHHLLLPKFINSHTHLGDSILKDQAYQLSLNEAVGVNGYKYQTIGHNRIQRIAAMRSAIIEMIENGTAACCDFREGGLNGINELREAAKNLPIDLHILGRQHTKADLNDVISQCNGLGLATPLLFSRKELEIIRLQTSSSNVLVATHIGENHQIIQESKEKFGFSDLQVALKYLNSDILIHLTVTDEHELGEIPQSKFIVFCPRSNAYFGLGFPPVNYFLDKHHLLGLGTDNVMVNTPNVLEELRWLVLRLKEQGISIEPIQALQFITTNPSKPLKLLTGCIQVGYWADLLAINLQSNRTLFGADPVLTLLFRCQLPEDITLNLFHGEEVTDELV